MSEKLSRLNRGNRLIRVGGWILVGIGAVPVVVGVSELGVSWISRNVYISNCVGSTLPASSVGGAASCEPPNSAQLNAQFTFGEDLLAAGLVIAAVGGPLLGLAHHRQQELEKLQLQRAEEEQREAAHFPEIAGFIVEIDDLRVGEPGPDGLRALLIAGRELTKEAPSEPKLL